MSLLMDALKKAEQEKKDAAKRQDEIETGEAREEIAKSSESLDATNTWEHEIQNPDSTAEIPTMGDATLHSNTAELELEPIINADDTAELPTMAGAAASSPEPEDPTLNVTMNELSLAELKAGRVDIEEVDNIEESDAPIAELQTEDVDLDETFHGVSLDDTAINLELFQETVQGEAFLPDGAASDTWGETLPGIPAAQLAKDIGSDDQPTPVAAQTVFAASGTRQSSGHGYKWGIAILLFIFLAAGSVYYYFTITPTNRFLPSPQIAQGIESVGPPLSETLDLRPASSMSADSVQEKTNEALAVVEAHAEAMLEEQSAEIVEAENNVIVDEPEEPGVVEKVADALGVVSDAVIESIADTRSVEKLPESIQPEPSLIQISRSKKPDDKGKTLRGAYQAYQKGAYGTAEDMYQQTLNAYPDNRDALLGLGAVAANAADYQKAYEMYARVLKSNPRDKFARAALINLQESSYLSSNESVITTMLHESPDQHFLHFTLGNIYAAGSRWAEAQQSFFDAYRLNSTSADYALNLAVSLDHIGQYETALDYYNVALELASNTPPGFEPDTIVKRIAELTETSGFQP
ncbi:MAG: tetratricopeptide repeat protein [Gammaproteobacteria bacterium]|nr:tetratricopeptide repeat protein [Gammaproteobacteria bacterium]